MGSQVADQGTEELEETVRNNKLTPETIPHEIAEAARHAAKFVLEGGTRTMQLAQRDESGEVWLVVVAHGESAISIGSAVAAMMANPHLDFMPNTTDNNPNATEEN